MTSQIVKAALVAVAFAGTIAVVNQTSPAENKSDKKEIVLTDKNTLSLTSEVSDASMAALMSKAMALDSKTKSNDPIYLVLYTPGGSIQAGLEAIEFLKSLNRPVHTVTIFAASMGFQMVQGLGNRYITRFGTLMAHKAKGSFAGEFPGQIDSRYTYYVKKLNELDNITVGRTGGKLTDAAFKALYENEYWVDGFDALGKGLVDEVTAVRCDASLSGTREETESFLGFSVKLNFSKCPMIIAPVGAEAEVLTSNMGILPLPVFLQKGGVFGVISTVTNVPHPTMLNLTLDEINKTKDNLVKERSTQPKAFREYR
jgi:ATP-dependent protease ClpP protease subunit